MGKMVSVEVIETGKHFLKSKLVENSNIKEPGLSKPLEKGEVSGLSNITSKEVDTVSYCLTEVSKNKAAQESHDSYWLITQFPRFSRGLL